MWMDTFSDKVGIQQFCNLIIQAFQNNRPQPPIFRQYPVPLQRQWIWICYEGFVRDTEEIIQEGKVLWKH